MPPLSEPIPNMCAFNWSISGPATIAFFLNIEYLKKIIYVWKQREILGSEIEGGKIRVGDPDEVGGRSLIISSGIHPNFFRT